MEGKLSGDRTRFITGNRLAGDGVQIPCPPHCLMLLYLFRKSRGRPLPMRIEEQIADLFKLCLPLALPVLNLFMRLVLNVISKDITGIHRRLFALPEDLIFMAMALETAGIAGVIPAFTVFYTSRGHDPVRMGLAVCLALFGVALLSHWWSRTQVQTRFQNVYISGYEVEKRIKRARRTKSTPPPSTREYFLLFQGDYILGICMWAIELSVCAYCLYYVATILIS